MLSVIVFDSLGSKYFNNYFKTKTIIVNWSNSYKNNVILIFFRFLFFLGIICSCKVVYLYLLKFKSLVSSKSSYGSTNFFYSLW